MPDLKSDVIGRINRLPLKPSDRTALLPLMEAVSNSIYAITERFDEQAVKQGRIMVDIIRDLNKEDLPIIGFDVEDNGLGFTEKNYESFITPDSRHKEKRGGKGVGRLAWLKVFSDVTIDSVYYQDTGLKRRDFRFRLTENDQVQEISHSQVASNEPVATRISFRGFESRFANRCPSKNGTIALRLLSHFVPLFVGGNAPKILVRDGNITDIEEIFADSIVNETTSKITLSLDGEDVPIEIWSLKCKKSVRFDSGGKNHAFITGNNRSVVEYSIDEQIGLKTLEGEYVYIGCVSSPYLDLHVNSERTGFTIDNDEVDQIKRALAKEARTFLQQYIDEALAIKVHVTKDIIIENPQFIYVESDIKSFVEGLQPNISRKEDIFVELSRNRFRRQKTFVTLENEIKKSDYIDGSIKQKIDEYEKFISLEKKSALAEYVIRRKAVTDLFEKFLEYKDTESTTYHREDAIHQLISPMKADSHSLTIEDHNLWLIDDRLAFFHYFASDKPLKSYSGVDDGERPDLAFFYDSCIAWREGENTDTVVLVEFKKPMRDNYTSGLDPVQQILHYVKKLKNERGLPDLKGKAIRGINEGTAFHCYVIVDVTPTLESSIIGRFTPTPDGEGFFGYSPNPAAFVEIIPYGKLLKDARLRNSMFFKTLGISGEG